MSTKTLIQTISVGASPASTISFASIPATYDDLVLELSLRSDRAANLISAIKVEFNGVTTGYTNKWIEGNGASASSGSSMPNILVPAATATANVFGSISVYIPNYASANYKSFSIDEVMETNGATAYADLLALLWSNTAAISSIVVTDALGNFVQYSMATLYGVKNS